jgi:hypothetical protein
MECPDAGIRKATPRSRFECIVIQKSTHHFQVIESFSGKNLLGYSNFFSLIYNFQGIVHNGVSWFEYQQSSLLQQAT